MYTIAVLLFILLRLPLFSQTVVLKGRVRDTKESALPKASVKLLDHERVLGETTTGAEGQFQLSVVSTGQFVIKVEATGFRPVTQAVTVRAAGVSGIDISIKELSTRGESVTVTADLNEGDVLSPDAAMKVFASEDLLDANPGRPGAPISIPGYPVETASGGIKAPQYFAPGVAGDHGEPIAQFVQVGSYLVPNNLSANAHGNGYADPNIYIANVIESVQVDGGAYNVREGNHALNLAAIYGLRSHLDPFLTLTGDDRDITATAGMSPSENSWTAVEGSFGNGFLYRLEHRKQFKFNGGRVFHAKDHTLTLFGLAYLGYGYAAGLRPIYGFNSVDAAAGWKSYPDTIDPRQRDQTHTALLAANDVWKLDDHQDLQFSGFFRTYNLSLYSDFGLGLIRQSEFRTVGGGSVEYVNKITKTFTLLAGTDYEREAPRRDNLDHYNFYNPAAPYSYGPFVKIIGNNVTIVPVTPYVAGQGELSKYVRYYLGWRRDEIDINNQDLLTPANSWHKWVGVNSPKVTITFLPEQFWYIPLISLSFGKSFFTEDPRAGAAFNGPTSSDPVETARSYHLVASKTFHRTDVKLTLGHETQSAEYGKIDSDQGLQFPLGPGRIRFLAVTVRQSLPNGSLQATFEQADARLTNTFPTTGIPGDSFSIIPEAPRLIGDISGTYQKLPFHLQAKAEFEYVGQKVVGSGCSEGAYWPNGVNVGIPDPNALSYYCLGVPNKEFRLAVARPFLDGRINVGVNMMFASGWTGQTTENFGKAGVYAPGAVGLDSNKLVPGNPVNEVAGVRIPSYASVNLTYRFARTIAP
jgi:hypothetical protein